MRPPPGGQCCDEYMWISAESSSRCTRSCLWPGRLSPLNWSVILSPHEGKNHVEHEGTDKSEGSEDGHRREVHVRRGGLACSVIRTSSASPQEGAQRTRTSGVRTRQPRPPCPARYRAPGA